MSLRTWIDQDQYKKITGFKSACLNASMWIGNVVMCEKADRAPWGIKSTPIAAVVIAKRQSVVIDVDGKPKQDKVKQSKDYDKLFTEYLNQFKELTTWKSKQKKGI